MGGGGREEYEGRGEVRNCVYGRSNNEREEGLRRVPGTRGIVSFLMNFQKIMKYSIYQLTGLLRLRPKKEN